MSCNFDFLVDGSSNTDNGNTDSGPVYTEVVTPITGGQKIEYFADGVLTCYDEKYFEVLADGSFGHMTQLQHYSSAGVLGYSKTWTYDANGLLSQEATYDSASVLEYFSTFAWVAVGVDSKESVVVKYDAAGSLLGARSYEYDAAGNCTFAGIYDAVGALTEAYVWEFNTDNKETLYKTYSGSTLTGKEETTYNADGTDSSILWYGATNLARDASIVSGLTATVSRTGVSPRGIARDLIVLPAAPAPAVAFTVPARSLVDDVNLGLVQSKYWRYDPFGVAWALLDKDWFPLEVERDDSRLWEYLSLPAAETTTVNVKLTWETTDLSPVGRRPTHKTTTIDGVVALDVAMSYDTTGRPLMVSTSGAAMSVPLDFGLEYMDNNIPRKLTISSVGATLRSFEYEYLAADGQSGPAQPSLDPTQLLAFARNVHVITERDGDGNLTEKFTFVYTNEGDHYQLRVDVTDAAAASTGWFLVEYDAAGLVGSVKSYDAAGTETWAWSCDYDTAMDGVDYAVRLSETYLSDSEMNYLQTMGQNFIYQLLFN